MKETYRFQIRYYRYGTGTVPVEYYGNMHLEDISENCFSILVIGIGKKLESSGKINILMKTLFSSICCNI